MPLGSHRYFHPGVSARHRVGNKARHKSGENLAGSKDPTRLANDQNQPSKDLDKGVEIPSGGI